MKKTCIALCLVLLLTALSACGGKTPASNEPSQQNEPAADALWVALGEQKLTLGMPFAEAENALGSETRPSEKMYPCDGTNEWNEIRHYYAGLTVGEDRDGKIDLIELDPASGASEASLNGAVQPGCTTDEALAALGEPDYPLDDDTGGLLFTRGGVTALVLLDFDTKATVTGVNLYFASED